MTAPGKVGEQGCWLKNLTALHSCLAKELNDISSERSPLPDWITLETTYAKELIPKRPYKGQNCSKLWAHILPAFDVEIDD